MNPPTIAAPLAPVASAAVKPANEPAYRRILVKLSGEALMGDEAYGIERETIDRIVAEIADVLRAGVQIAIVIGGGNIFRGVAPGAAGMDRATADYMGMLATLMNALALAGRAAARRRGIARAVGAAHRPGRRALHPRPRAAPPRGEPGRHLRRGHRQPVLHHRYRRRAARPRDGRGHRAQGDQGRRRLHRRSDEGLRRAPLRHASPSTRPSSRT